jgi:ATP-binding cassette, subfamily B, bacterial MsbA
VNSQLPPAVIEPGKVYRRLLGYARPHLGMFMIGVLGMALFAAMDSSMAWLVKVFLGGAFIEKDPRVLWIVPLGAILLFTLRGIGDYVSNYFPGWVGRQVIKSLRRELFEHYMRLPTSYHDTEVSAQMLSKLTYNIEQVAEACTSAVTSLIRDTLTIIGLLGMLFYLNWQLAALVLLLGPPLGWIVQFVNRLFRRYSQRIQGSMGDVTRVTRETLDAHRLIKVFNAEQFQSRRFEQVNEYNRHSHMRLISTRAITNPVVQVIAALGLAGILYYSISQVFTQALRVDEFMAFLTAMLLITAPLRRLVNVFPPLQAGIAAGASVFEVLDRPVEVDAGQRSLQRALGDIDFDGITFAYNADKGAVLSGVSLRVAAGQKVAIVGKSGGGKSTLVGLLPRLYEPQQGVVRLDGVDVREYRLGDLRRQVSLVSQDVVLFNDTIRANIAFGRPDATDAEIEAAAEAAYVMEFAAELPQGLDTEIGDRGAQLSGGQRQRISIARALLKDAPVLILDEATSALDTESERRIQAAFDSLMQGRTVLVIAHRLSTIESADRIAVIDEGRVAEQGSHAELIARGGLYAQLHRLQFNV